MQPVEGGFILGPRGWYKLTFYAAEDSNRWGQNTRGVVYYALQRTRLPEPESVLVPQTAPERFRDSLRLPLWAPSRVSFQPVYVAAAFGASAVAGYYAGAALANWSISFTVAAF